MTTALGVGFLVAACCVLLGIAYDAVADRFDPDRDGDSIPLAQLTCPEEEQ